MDTLRQDLRYALRVLWKDRAFAATALLTLALCIGANSAIFTVVHSVLLRPLPYPDADRLVTTYEAFPAAGVSRTGTSIPNYLDRLAFTDVFESQALYRFTGRRVGRGSTAEGVASMEVTPSFFKVLRKGALRGRTFQEKEGERGHHLVVVLSYGFASRQPGGVEGVVGRQLLLSDEPHTVVGIMPEDFTFLNPGIQLWTPLAPNNEERSNDSRYSHNQEEIARLADGVTIFQTQARLDAQVARNLENAGSFREVLVNAGYQSHVVPFHADLVRNVRAPLRLLWAGVLFVLLIAAVNITNLSLVRASARVREIATRHALGARRGRVLRQLVTEMVVLTVLGGALGLLLGLWGLDALAWLRLTDLPRASEIHMDAAVIAFTFGLALVLGVVVGSIPALQHRGLNLSTMLREESRSGTAGRGARTVRRGLVVAQVALAFVLLIGAGLLLVSFQRLLEVNTGFDPEHVLTARVVALPTQYPDNAAIVTYADRALERIRALPGVTDAGVTSFLPFSFDDSDSVIIPEGHAPSPGETVVSPRQLRVTPGYLEALRVPLKKGRLFTDSDREGAPPVIILEERLAQRFWPSADPIGRRVYIPRRAEDIGNPGPDVPLRTVVGVIGSVKLRGLVEGEDARTGSYYLPFAQLPQGSINFAVRTTGDAAALTAAVGQALRAIDPDVQPFDVVMLTERIEQSLNPRRAPMLLSLAFGIVALLLASLGIYGVLAYQVTQRTREIGIRLALGSDPLSVLRLILREGLLLAAVGLAAGAIGAVTLRSVIASQLYGIRPLDPMVMLSVIAILAAASVAACLGPAVRASKVDPVTALNS